LVSFTPRPLYTGERTPSAHSIGAGLDDVEKLKLLVLPGLELQPPGHPACRKSRMHYRCRFEDENTSRHLNGKNSIEQAPFTKSRLLEYMSALTHWPCCCHENTGHINSRTNPHGCSYPALEAKAYSCSWYTRQSLFADM
jgi:hypothetical protein